MSTNWANYKIIYEECYPGKGNKKSEIIILTSELSGQKVGDIEYQKGLTFEDSGDYRITRITNIAAERRRLKKEKEIKRVSEQVRASEIKRLNMLRAAFAADNFEFFLDTFENGWSVSQARAEYEKPSDERSYKVVTKDSETSEEKLIEKLQGQIRQRFSDLLNAFDYSDQDFAIESWKRGLTVAQAAEKYYAPQERTREVTRAKILVKSCSEDQGDFIATGKALAQAEGIKLGEALKRVARKQPELHLAYKEKCQGQNRAEYGREI